jgi:hypothetical protein
VLPGHGTKSTSDTSSQSDLDLGAVQVDDRLVTAGPDEDNLLGVAISAREVGPDDYEFAYLCPPATSATAGVTSDPAP